MALRYFFRRELILRRFLNFVAGRLWTVFTTLFVVVALLTLWLITPSTLFFRPVSWSYHPETQTATFVRVIANGNAAWVRWSHVVYTARGQVCSDNDIRFYDPRVRIEEIPIRDSLARCLDDPRNIAVLSWSPLLYGMIPLRPYTMTIPAGAAIPRAPVRVE